MHRRCAQVRIGPEGGDPLKYLRMRRTLGLPVIEGPSFLVRQAMTLQADDPGHGFLTQPGFFSGWDHGSRFVGKRLRPVCGPDTDQTNGTLV